MGGGEGGGGGDLLSEFYGILLYMPNKLARLKASGRFMPQKLKLSASTNERPIAFLLDCKQALPNYYRELS